MSHEGRPATLEAPGTRASAATPPARRRPRPRRRRRTLAAAVLLLAGGAAGAALSLWPHGPDAAYDWPLRPFDRQHAVRGGFGDPRHLVRWSFHDGVDIAAPDGTPVYAIAAGEVHLENREAVAVLSPASSADPPLTFGYWHIRPVVHERELVARHQLLGTIRPGWGHVHLDEQRHRIFVDPLRRGGLGPFRFTRRPVVERILLERAGRRLARTGVRGTVSVLVDAYVPPPLALPGAWAGARLAPTRVDWRLGRPSSPWRTSVDFSGLPTVPLQAIYGPGTRQNRAGHPGRYLLYLTHALDTRTLAPGPHRLDVRVFDARGGRTQASLAFSVAGQGR